MIHNNFFIAIDSDHVQQNQPQELQLLPSGNELHSFQLWIPRPWESHPTCRYPTYVSNLIFNIKRLDASANSDQLSKVRIFVLKTIALWTLLPLLVSPSETALKHMLFILDVSLTLLIFLRLNVNQIRSFGLKGLIYLMGALITVI